MPVYENLRSPTNLAASCRTGRPGRNLIHFSPRLLIPFRLLRNTRATEAAAILFLNRLMGRIGPCPLLGNLGQERCPARFLQGSRYRTLENQGGSVRHAAACTLWRAYGGGIVIVNARLHPLSMATRIASSVGFGHPALSQYDEPGQMQEN
jgi:hypothetical protein